MQEVKNAIDQASREVTTRFDFKNTESTIELSDHELRLHSATEDRLRALVVVIEEKLVRRKVSLKALDYGKVEEAAKGAVRQTVTLQAGISSDNARAINRAIKEKGPKGVGSPRPRATRSGSRPRSGTTCRPSSPPSRPRTSASRFSSRTSGDPLTAKGAPRQPPQGPARPLSARPRPRPQRA